MQYFPFYYKEYKNKKVTKNILLLHGWGCSGDVFNQYIESLKKKYNIYIIDFYGFGQSCEPKPFFDTYEYALQIYLFLKLKNIKYFDIFAHSFGGRIAIILNSLFDVNIQKMVLTGSAGLKPKRSLLYYFKLYKYKFFKKIFKKSTFGSRDYRLSSNTLKPVFVRVVNQHLNYLLSYVQSKTFLVWGSDDKETPMYMYKVFLKRIQCVEGIVVEGATHFIAFTHMYICKNKIEEFLINDSNNNY